MRKSCRLVFFVIAAALAHAGRIETLGRETKGSSQPDDLEHLQDHFVFDHDAEAHLMATESNETDWWEEFGTDDDAYVPARGFEEHQEEPPPPLHQAVTQHAPAMAATPESAQGGSGEGGGSGEVRIGTGARRRGDELPKLQTSLAEGSNHSRLTDGAGRDLSSFLLEDEEAELEEAEAMRSGKGSTFNLRSLSDDVLALLADEGDEEGSPGVGLDLAPLPSMPLTSQRPSFGMVADALKF